MVSAIILLEVSYYTKMGSTNLYGLSAYEVRILPF